MSSEIISASVETVTPFVAEQLLTKNGINRPLRARLVDRYAQAMARGAWVLNGEPIVIGASGRLLDGQHRLHAVAAYGLPVKMLVVRGVPNEEVAFHTLNSGALRSSSDRLQAAGESHSALMASSLRMVYRYLYGMTTNMAGRTFTPDLLFATLQEHGGVREWMDTACRLNSYGFNPSIMSFLLYAGSHYDKKLADEFAMQCETGENLAAQSPVSLLRNRVIKNKSVRGLTQINRTVEVAIYVKAWNAFATGAPIGLLRWSPIENFPEVVGFPMKKEEAGK